jgi:hypothetical protein
MQAQRLIIALWLPRAGAAVACEAIAKWQTSSGCGTVGMKYGQATVRSPPPAILMAQTPDADRKDSCLKLHMSYGMF